MRNRLLKSFALFVLFATVFAGCKKDEPTYMVQVTATEGGTVEGQNGEYKEGETVVFTAIPAMDYYFTKWSDGNTDNPRTITITNAEITLTAQFAQMLLLTISASENGSIETDVNGRYAPGSSVTVTAKPAADCYFAGWSDGNSDNPRTIIIGNEDVILAANFFESAVDLGLPSDTKWTRCNLGAVNPWDYGAYYAWGETETKDDYSWETYKYCKGSYETLTKYCNNAEYGNSGFTDGLTTLEASDDVATVVFGSDYSMPTDADWYELDNQCYWVWTENYNEQSVSGYIVYKTKSANDKGIKVFSDGTPSTSYSLKDVHIFLPATGCRNKTSLNGAGKSGYYWSGSLNDVNPYYARYCVFQSNKMNPSGYDGRFGGLSVRPVRHK